MTGARLARTPSLAGLFRAAPVSETGVGIASVSSFLYSCREMGRNGSTAINRRCSATNKRGERCKARAVERGLCAAHAGLVDMQAIGRKGGKVRPQTRIRMAADDTLREKARAVLERALAGEDVPKAALDSARSLFSYRADSPPFERQADGEDSGPRLADGRRPVSLADVVRFAVDIGAVGNMPELVAACRLVVDAADAGGTRVS